LTQRVLEKLHAYLQEQRAAALPKSPLGAAIGYALRNWVALTRYAEDGRLKIDNNGAEQALRPIVLGAKTGCSPGASGRPSHRHPVFARPHLQALADQSIRVSARCDPACLDASGAAGPGADATRVEAPAAGFRRTSRRLNGAFLTIRPRLLPVFVDLNLRIDRYLRPRSSLSATGRSRWSWKRWSHAYKLLIGRPPASA